MATKVFSYLAPTQLTLCFIRGIEQHLQTGNRSLVGLSREWSFPLSYAHSWKAQTVSSILSLFNTQNEEDFTCKLSNVPHSITMLLYKMAISKEHNNEPISELTLGIQKGTLCIYSITDLY